MRPRRPFVPGALGMLLIANVMVEAVLLAADQGLLGSRLWRMLAYQYGGFWAGLLRDWDPNYPAQPFVMFISYSFLHTGPAHLLGNLLVLGFLGREVVERFDWRTFLLLYGSSAFGGALVFGILARSPAPMIGASGAIFGLASAVILHEGQRRSLAWTLAAFAALLFVHAIAWVSRIGPLAWETHLGGGLTGVALTVWILWR